MSDRKPILIFPVSAMCILDTQTVGSIHTWSQEHPRIVRASRESWDTQTVGSIHTWSQEYPGFVRVSWPGILGYSTVGFMHRWSQEHPRMVRVSRKSWDTRINTWSQEHPGIVLVSWESWDTQTVGCSVTHMVLSRKFWSGENFGPADHFFRWNWSGWT